MAARQAFDCEPASSRETVAAQRFCCIVGARRQEAARSAEMGRKKDLVASNHREREADGEITAAGECVVRGCGGNRLQEQSGWRRAVPVSARRRRRNRTRSCFDGKPLVSSV